MPSFIITTLTSYANAQKTPPTQPPWSVEMNTTSSPSCNAYASPPSNSQSASLIRTNIPGRLFATPLSKRERKKNETKKNAHSHCVIDGEELGSFGNVTITYEGDERSHSARFEGKRHVEARLLLVAKQQLQSTAHFNLHLYTHR